MDVILRMTKTLYMLTCSSIIGEQLILTHFVYLALVESAWLTGRSTTILIAVQMLEDFVASKDVRVTSLEMHVKELGKEVAALRDIIKQLLPLVQVKRCYAPDDDDEDEPMRMVLRSSKDDVD